MWNLILRRDYGDIIIKTYSSKKEAEEELRNRSRLITHLGEDVDKLYKIERGKKRGDTGRNLQV